MTSLSRRPAVQRGFSPPPQYDPYALQLGYLSERVHRLLTERECAIFDRGLADYHRRHNVEAFVECLSLVLNTNQKRQLLIPIRDTYVKPSDISKFNQLVQVHGLAMSLKRKRKEADEAREKSKASEGVHKIEVKRDPSGDWGFNIRGGSEHGIGIFVSWVDPGSSAQRNGLQVGDQILKASDTNFENISHYEAVQLMKSSKKLRLWVLSRGRIPSSHTAHKVYRWVDAEGRPTTPPPDPFEQKSKGESNRVLSEADERKVTVMVDAGQELGISIRGGAEHGLGIYISAVEEGSVAETYGIKVGDQILEVNGISFFSIVHSDAANALRAQPCMVMKLKDVGKLPHSRITTYGQTHWHTSPSSPPRRNQTQEVPPSPVFTQGMGTQVMLKKQDRSIPGKGMMNEVARSVLTAQELSTFNYYINQYQSHRLPVQDLVTPLLDLLNTPEKLQLLSEVRTILMPWDLQQFNELTVHREIAAKKAAKKSGGSIEGSITGLPQRNVVHTTAHIHGMDAMQFSPPNPAEFSFESEDQTLTQEEDGEGSEEGGRDHVPQKLSPPHTMPVAGVPVFHAPPPPAPATSTPENHYTPDPQSILADTLKERRKRMQSGAREQLGDETWDSQWNESSLSSVQSGTVVPRRRPGGVETAGPGQGVRISVIERKVRSETEDKLRKEFEEKETRIIEEQQRCLEEERQQHKQMLQQEREAMERQLREVEERVREEMEEHIRHEAEDEMRRQLEEKEREILEEQARKAAEEKQRLEQMQQEALEQQIREMEEQKKQELEEKIWKEAEEHMRKEFETQMQQEREMLVQQAAQKQQITEEQAARKLQEKLYRQAEQKYKQEYEQRIQREKQEMRKREEEEIRRKQEEEKAKREAEVARLEAEEQARIELEETIRREAEAKARAEYEELLQRETEERARLAEEVKARRAAEERLEQERREQEQEIQRKRQEAAVQTRRQEQEQHRCQQAEREHQHQQAEREERQRQQAERERQRQQAEREHQRQQAERERQHQQAERERQRQQAEREESQRQQAEREESQRQQMQEEERQHQQQHHNQLTQEEEEEERRLEIQRRQRKEEEREEERREQERNKAAEEEQRRQEAERKRRRELEKKREENLRRREEEQKQRELEQKRKREDDRKKKQQQQQPTQMAQYAKQQGQARRPNFNVQHVKVNFGDDEPSAKKSAEKSKSQLIEEERRKAEEKLQRRLERKRLALENSKKEAATATRAATEDTDPSPPSSASPPLSASPPPSAALTSEGKTFAGYTNLHGEILTITVTKVCKKLGIAIDGGANTKQKAVIIREISPGGCVEQTGTGMKVGQQILQVNGTSLKGLKHRDTVMTIKNAFEGPLDKTIEFVVLDYQTDE